jgi:rod shape-determining protein MreD
VNQTAATLQRPPSTQLMAFTLFAALMLDLLPWQGVLLLARPDFLLLMLLYWVMQQPLRVGMAAAWSLGLAMDVADGALFGQYALAYTVAVYLALILHRRIQAFGLWQQALHVSFLLATSQILVLLIHLASGANFIGWRYFLATLTGTLCWPGLALLMQLARKQLSVTEIGYTSSRMGEK